MGAPGAVDFRAAPFIAAQSSSCRPRGSLSQRAWPRLRFDAASGWWKQLAANCRGG